MINVGLDTEDNAGTPTMYALSWRGGEKLFTPGPESRLELARMLTMMGETVNVWCLNLGYDLVNTFGEVFLEAIVPYCARRKIAGAHLRGNSGVRLMAIERFIPKMNLQELGDAVRLKKLMLPFDDPRRCLRDAKIARVVGERICSTMDHLNIPVKYSPVSGAFFSLEEEAGAKLPLPSYTVMRSGRDALYGGRTEVYYKGKRDGGSMYYFDLFAAYGRAMLEPLPDYSEFYKSFEPREKYYIAEAKVRVKSKNGVCPLPHRIEGKKDAKGGVVFPEGTFEGTWVSQDLEHPLVEVLEYKNVLNFPRQGNLLASLVKRLIPQKAEHPISKAIKKNLYTGISGKFSQNNEYTVFMHSSHAKPVDLWTGVPFGEYVLTERAGKYPRNTNFVWSAFINARNRRWHWDLYEDIWKHGGQIMYGDTDSALAYLKAPYYAKKIWEDHNGALKPYASIQEAEILSPKTYRLITKEGKIILSTKGVPKRLAAQAVVFGEDVIEGEVPDSFFMLLKANMATGHPFKNTWRKKHWKLSHVNRNRQFFGTSPWTRPIRLEDGKVLPSVV